VAAAFVPLIIAAALINGWINTALLQHSRVNPAVIAAAGRGHDGDAAQQESARSG
jgi:hypothetical protein